MSRGDRPQKKRPIAVHEVLERGEPVVIEYGGVELVVSEMREETLESVRSWISLRTRRERVKHPMRLDKADVRRVYDYLGAWLLEQRP